MTPESLYRLEEKLATLLDGDPWHRDCLCLVRDVLGPDCWIAAGFVRNIVWDLIFGDGTLRPETDVDVLFFDTIDQSPATEQALQARLTDAAPNIPWQVRNQARMHERNGDRPYIGLRDAMTFWLETATGIAVRRSSSGGIDILSAYGLSDLFDGILRPTPSGTERRNELEERMAAKAWLSRWPGVRYLPDEPAVRAA